MTFNVYDTDFVNDSAPYKVAESGSVLGATMRALAVIWQWAQFKDINEIVQYTNPDGSIRIVPKTDGVFWDHGITINEE